jgi:hypothetical protein
MPTNIPTNADLRRDGIALSEGKIERGTSEAAVELRHRRVVSSGPRVRALGH